jgi:uncharacterized YigZ family protein
MPSYLVPKGTTRAEYHVSNSRFITTVSRADTVEAAKAFIQRIQTEMPDATHHVYAFIVGFGASVIEGMSDDGEPAGTAGPPTLAVLRGARIGDVALVTSRYFGGTKLGTGGLVHAYGQAARGAIAALKTEEKISRKIIGVEIPYHLYERVKRLAGEYAADIQDEDFATAVLLVIRIPEDHLPAFSAYLLDLSAGQIQPTLLDNDPG